MSDDVSRRRFVGLLGAGAGFALAGCSDAPSADTERPPGEPDPQRPNDGDDAPLTTLSNTTEPVSGSRFAEVYRAVRNSVVQIQVQTGSGTASGTGWVYDGDGHLVTNQHVVSGANRVFVRFRSTGWRSAEVVATDVYSDLAIVGVDSLPDPAGPLSLATSDPPVGTEVLAIGNPFGLSGSVSSGIVSGVNRTLPAANNFSIPDAIQTDAPVNPGNSGGPLVDLNGVVVGVINSGGGDNIGFAISGALVSRVVPSLLENGAYKHPYLGIRLGSVTPALAKANGLSVASGVYVYETVEGAPADGVLQGQSGTEFVFGSETSVGGDVIKRMEGRKIPTTQALSSFLALETRPGETIEIEIVRDGEPMTVDLTVGTRPDPF